MINNRLSKKVTLIITLSCALVLSGCVGLSKAPQRYILLSANSNFVSADTVNTNAATADSELSIGLMPITLSAHLDKEKLVQYDKYQQIQYQDDMLWAESLADNSSRVVLDYLSILLAKQESGNSVANLALFPWTVKSKPETVVTVSIHRFGYNESTERFDLVGTWNVAQDGITNTSVFNYHLSDQDYSDKDSASSTKKISGFYTLALAKLSEDIALQLAKQ